MKQVTNSHWWIAGCVVLLLSAGWEGYRSPVFAEEVDVTELLAAETPLEPNFLLVGHFSAAQPGGPFPDNWKPLTFKKISRYTIYQLEEDEERVAVMATSDASSSGLTREISIDPKKYPILEWEWKITNIFPKGDVTKKEGDDYPARIYITFEYDSSRVGVLDKAKYEAARLLYGKYPPLNAINYIWASTAEVGTMVPNPYTKEVMMFVVRSGQDERNTWVQEQTNIYEDYLKAFGEEPPMISGVAIMTDTDNTKGTAKTYFGDITFRKP